MKYSVAITKNRLGFNQETIFPCEEGKNEKEGRERERWIVANALIDRRLVMKKFVALPFFSIYLLFVDAHTFSDCDLSLVDFYRYISAIHLPTVFLVIVFQRF